MSRIAKAVVLTAAAGAVAAWSAGAAFANTDATGDATHSPGVISGNDIQVPAHLPINVCGNTVDVVGILNPALADACGNR